MPTATPARVTAPAVHRPRGVRRVLYESAYSLSAFPIALVALVVVVIDLSLGIALVVFIGGILLIIGVLHGLNIVVMPVLGRLFSLNRRLPTRDHPGPD